MQTFVVRVWSPTPKPSEPELDRLCGVVEELGSGRSTTFADDGELLAFLLERRQRELEVGTGGAS